MQKCSGSDSDGRLWSMHYTRTLIGRLVTTAKGTKDLTEVVEVLVKFKNRAIKIIADILAG